MTLERMMQTVAWTQLAQAMRADGMSVSDTCPPHIAEFIYALASDTGERGVGPPVDCMGLALDLEQQAERGVASQTAERAMRAAATGLRRIAALRAQPAGGGEQDAVLAERTALLNAGGPLANIAFNLAQSPRLTDAERKSLDECRKAWDAACMSLIERHALTQPQPVEGGPCEHDGDWDTSGNGQGYTCADCGAYMKDAEPEQATPPESGGQGERTLTDILFESGCFPTEAAITSTAREIERWIAAHPPAQASGAVTDSTAIDWLESALCEGSVTIRCRHMGGVSLLQPHIGAWVDCDGTLRDLLASLAQGGGNEH